MYFFTPRNPLNRIHRQPGKNNRMGRWILTVLALMLTLHVHAQEALSKKIAITLQDASPKQALTAIQQASGSRILFGEDINKFAANKVTIKSEAITVKEALELALKNTNLIFEQMSGNILIKERPAPQTPTSPNVQAGQGTGGIKGRIVEFETSQPLPGASVFIVELKRGAQSDENGYYRFSGLPAGKYTLQVSFVAFTSENVTVNVNSNREATYDVKLQGSNALEEVTVTAIGKTRRPVAHTTERQVLEEVKAASVVVSAISSEQISKSADRNAAEAVQKVAGVSVVDDKFVIVRGLNPRYNLTYLNDNVAPSTEVYSRAFALDLIPSRIIDKIMVYKSAGPETLADATGGVVKIYTKDAKAVKHFDIELQMGHRKGTTFNNNFLTYNGGKWDWLGFDDGTRKLPSSVPGYDQLALAQLTPSQYAETFNPTLTYQRITALPNMQLTANYYNAFRIWGKTLSTLTSFSYKKDAQKADVYRQQGINEGNASSTDVVNNDNRNTSTAQLNLLQNFTLRLRDSSTLSFKNFILQQGQALTIVRSSNPTSYVYPEEMTMPFIINKDNILSYNQRFLYAGNLGGTHYYNKGLHKIQWNGGYTFSRQGTPDQRVIRLKAPNWRNAASNPDLQWYARGYSPESSDAFDPIPLKLGIISRLWMQNSEGVYNASADYVFQYKPWLSFKAGTFQQWKERRLYRRIYTVHEGDMENFEGKVGTGSAPGASHWLNPGLVRFREQDLPNVWRTDYFRDDLVGLRVYDRTTGSDSYTGTEQNNAGYLAFSFTPDNRKVEVYGGVRYEYNRQQIGASIPRVTNEEINTPIHIDNPMRTWLPSVNASWRPSDSWVVRAAYGKTVNRTEFREVAPYKELDYETNTEIGGNPALQSATINNYDFRVEFYPRKNAHGETITAGVFYKELKNPIEVINTSSRIESIFPSLSYQNGASATIKGLEIEMNKKLDFVPGKFFRDLSVIANVSLIKSEVKNDTTSAESLTFSTDKRPLQGQAPYIINAGLYYDNAAWGTKVSAIYNVSGTKIYAAGRGYSGNDFIIGPEFRGSILELPRHMLDVAVTQRLFNTVQGKISIQNLLNQEIKMAEDYNFTNKYEPVEDIPGAGPGDRSVRQGDNISSSFRPGRYIVISLSYSF